jgi:hypothetical protein
MKFSRTPDLGPWRRMALAALAAGLVAVVVLIVKDGQGLAERLGDTDDAMRMVMARALAAGQGWYEQKVVRLQPPVGVYMHWSRLIDGGLAAFLDLFHLFLPQDKAELATRFVWPLMWIFPAVAASVAVARRLGGGAAVFACAIILALDMPLFLQFRPGRIDHHNVQIAMCMLALAGAAIGRVRGAALSGLATALGMAVGLEALAFEVIIGAYFALRFPLGDSEDVRALKAYGASFAIGALAFFMIQTPPWRWGVAACDAIAINLVAGIAVLGAGLFATARLTARRDWRARLAALAATGAAAAAVYIALDPNCLHGPFADVAPPLKVFWLPNVQEIRPIPRLWKTDHATVWSLVAPMVLGAAAWIWLALRRRKGMGGFLALAGVCLLAASAAGWSAIRMAGYADWFADPLIAAAVVDLAERYLGGAMLATAAGACVLTPMFLGAGLGEADKAVAAMGKPKPKAKPGAPTPKRKAKGPVIHGDRCFQAAPYAALAKLPPGIVLSEVDLGPFILAHTPSSALAAPYHRMSWGLLHARAALSTEAEAAQGPTRKLGAAYVLECPTHARNADRVGMPANSLQKRLDANKPPSWLDPVPTNGWLRLYKVKPATGAPS